MSDYGLTVQKGDFSLTLHSDDRAWMATEITLWRDALLSGQLALALARKSPTTQPAPPKPAASTNLPSDAAATTPADFDTVFATALDTLDTLGALDTQDTSGSADPWDGPQSIDLPDTAMVADNLEQTPDTLQPVTLEPATDKAARFKAVSVSKTRGADAGSPNPTADCLDALQVSSPTLAQWLQDNPPGSPIQCLLAASCYLADVHQQSQFALPTLNDLLKEAGLSAVNHGTLQDALDDGLLALVASTADDLSAAMAYQLTETGLTDARRARTTRPKPAPRTRKRAS